VAIEITFTPGVENLFSKDFRYKILAGGRGSSKSWSVARSLLIRGAQTKQRWLCCRELQNSIAESVHKLFTDQIDALGLSKFYTVQRDGVFGLNGSEFFYAGLRNDPQKVKSTEGLDGAWIEEGQTISAESWDILDPTVRKEGSEIIVTYNPRFEEDHIHKLFYDPATRPPRTWYKELNYMDNPWFSEVNRAQMEHMKRTNPLMYEHVWLGKCVPSLSTALWDWDSIDKNRLPLGSEFQMARCVVAVDPAVTANKNSDETGIVVAGCAKGAPRHYYVLADYSGKFSPETWARRALDAYDTYQADALVFEVNQGGALVTDTVRNVCRLDNRAVPRLIEVRASRGKVVRAEPIAALYTQGLVHHVGYLPDLERQLMRFNPVPTENKGQKSPDRMDALVWALTQLSEGRAPMQLAATAVARLSRLR
jgi:phage terminase large subunit-like protein